MKKITLHIICIISFFATACSSNNAEVAGNVIGNRGRKVLYHGSYVAVGLCFQSGRELCRKNP